MRVAWWAAGVIGVAAAAAAAGGCGDNLALTHESPYWLWDGQTSVGSLSLDALTSSDVTPTLADFDLAHHDGDVMMVYAHIPGQTVDMTILQTVLQRAQELDLEFFTFADLAAGTAHRRGICISFDDNAIDAWYTLRPLFAQYGARGTFFVTRYPGWTDDGKAKLHQLYADGNSIEAHGLNHLNAEDYVAANGIDAYIADEVQPSIDLLRADGFAPVAFAYPFGRHSEDIDDALAPLISITRGISTSPGRHGPTEDNPMPMPQPALDD